MASMIDATKNNMASMIDAVFSCVIPYLQNGNDLNSFSLICRNCYELDRLTRRHVTVHVCYTRLIKRFTFLESLTLKGLPLDSIQSHINITQWIELLATSNSFNRLKTITFRNLRLVDSDLELLARTRGKQLRVLKIINCSGFSSDGLMHVGYHCNYLTSLCLQDNHRKSKDGRWLHELAVRNTVIESLSICDDSFYRYDFRDLTLIAKNCSESLVSLKLLGCRLIDLRDLFRYAVRLEVCDFNFMGKTEELNGLRLPPSLRCISLDRICRYQFPIVLPFAHQLTELNLLRTSLESNAYAYLIKKCPNLEVLFAAERFGDRELQLIGQFCKKLRKLKTYTRSSSQYAMASHKGLIAVAQGCIALECLHIHVIDITNEAIECIGAHLRNLRDFHISLLGIESIPLDNGIRALLSGCIKLETLGIRLWPGGGLTDVGLECIGKYGHNLRYLSLGYTGASNAGLLKLSKGCPKLRKLKLEGCPFSEHALFTCMFNITSLRYLWVCKDAKLVVFAMTRQQIVF